MKSSFRLFAALLVLTAFVTLPAFAQGNTYTRSKPVWKGDVRVLDAKTGEPIEGTFVVGRNVPFGYSGFGLLILNNDDGRIYDKADENGMAKAQVRPFGTLQIWAPGYWPVQDLNFMGGDTGIPGPDADGVVNVRLRPAASEADRKAAALQAAKILEYENRDSLINVGKRRNRSAVIRAEARQALIAEGVEEPE